MKLGLNIFLGVVLISWHNILEMGKTELIISLTNGQTILTYSLRSN